MSSRFAAAVPEIPVEDVDGACEYYQSRLGFAQDWRDQDGGLAGISRGDCRLFLADAAFRAGYGNVGPVLIWINVFSKQEVIALFEEWKSGGAGMVSEPEDKPWNLREFTAKDLDGNLLRVFYDFTRDAAQG